MVQCLLFFPGWPARYWVWLTSTVLLLLQHIFWPISMWRPIISPGVSCFQSCIFSLRWFKQHFAFGAHMRWTCWHPPLLLETPLPLGALGLNAFNHSWKFQVSYMFPSALVPLILSKFLAEHVKGQLRLLILVTPCWMEAPWHPTVLIMLAYIPWHCPIIKDVVVDVSVHVLKGLPYLHLTLWQLRAVCCTDRGSLPQSVKHWLGQLEHLHQRSTSSAGRNGQVVYSRRCTKQCHICP